MADTNLSKSLSSIVNSLSGLYDAQVAQTTRSTAISSVLKGFEAEAAVSAAISGLRDDITTLNGDAETAGSVAKAVKDASDAITSTIGTNADESISSTTIWSAISEVNSELSETIETNRVSAYDALTGEAEIRSNADSAISAAIGEGFDSENTVKAAIEAVQTAAISVSGAANNAVEVTSQGVNKTVGLKINANDKFLSQTSDGLSATFSLKKVTDGLSSDISAEYYIADKDGNQVGDRISIAKDKFLKSAEFVQGSGSGDDKLQLTFNTADGTEDVVDIPLSGLFDEYTEGDGISLTATATGIEIAGVVDSTSEAFLTVGANGFKLSGVNDAITAAVDAETTRATGVEGALRTDLDALSGDFTAKLAGVQDTVTGLIDAEETARLTADNTITGYIKSGLNIAGDLTAESVATNCVSAQVASGISAYDTELTSVFADLEAVKAKIDTL